MTTVFKRCVEDVKEAFNVFCKKNMHEEAVQVALELYESKYGSYVIEQLRILAVEEKFPEGLSYLSFINDLIKKWKIISKPEKRLQLCAIVSSIAKCSGSRHVLYLRRLSENNSNDSKEEILASRMEKILNRYKMKSDFPTTHDMDKKTVLKKLHWMIFQGEKFNPIEDSLWQVFLDYMDKRIVSKSFLFCLLCLRTHVREYLPKKVPEKCEVKIVKVDLPDYVFNKNTKKGKTMKRDMEHFLQTTETNNPYPLSDTMKSTKRKANVLLLTPCQSRKKIRLDLLKFSTFFNNVVLDSTLLKTPTKSVPGCWMIETSAAKYVVQGPYQTLKDVSFQLEIENFKESKGLKKTGYKKYNNGLQWLYYPFVESMSLKKNTHYNDDEMHEIVKILLFRAYYGCKTELNNILYLENKSFISVFEVFKGKRKGTLLNYFFSKKPDSRFLIKLIIYIKDHFQKVDLEFRKYNQSLKNFNIKNINIK